jgi:hypothetical protein
MMVLNWPKRIDGGQAEWFSSNAHPTGVSEGEIRPRFWPATKTVENVAGWSVRPRVHHGPADSSDATASHAGVCSTARLDDRLAGPRGELRGGATRNPRELLEAARRREIDLVLVWRLDRWGRSVTDLLATLQELEHL